MAVPTPAAEAGAGGALELAAKSLASTHGALHRAVRFFEPPALGRPLERAQKQLSAAPSSDPVSKPAEWFLDNAYLIRRVARQVEEEFPPGFARHLPALASGPGAGRPRVEVLARAFVAFTQVTFDVTDLRDFVVAYQATVPLTIAELWALPAMLRASVLQHLLHALGELGVHFDPRDRRAFEPAVTGGPPERPTEPGAGVERGVRALRVLDVLDWKRFFANTNRVEAILRADPAQLYAKMDFETCDSYRKIIESLAWATDRPEENVAKLVVSLAREAPVGDRRGLVGYFLVGEGRAVLEARLGYRAMGLERLRRALQAWPTTSYLVALVVLTCAPLLVLAWPLSNAVGPVDGGRWVALAVAMVVAVVPVSAIAVVMAQFAFARLLPPRTLPKLDFTAGLPSTARTLVVMPTLLGRAEDVVAMTRQIELHYLSNPDPQLQFALLTDNVDALDERSTEPALLERAAQRIAALNAQHGNAQGGPFHLLHREPRWNAAEGRFMGWERKRGKLEELNRLLRGDTATTFTRHVGDPKGLLGVRFVITLDSDTELPMGSAARLIGVLAHPLNHAVFDAETGRVTAGYTIVQPRIDTSPSSERATLFSRIFSGDVGLDIYTHASSELYQDLFGSGIYVGKGIYEVDAFMRSVKGRAPENTLVSHDLFEGVHGRTALVSDIVLFETYPSNYATYAMRMHRWVRGDWQLLPWLLATVPSALGDKVGNTLVRIDRWKIADNLRRSLNNPTVLLLLVLGWVWLPGSPWGWSVGALGLLLGPFVPSLTSGPRRRFEHWGRALLAVVFWAYEATVVVDAIARVVVRKLFTRKHLLQWTSAAHAAFGVASRSARGVFWQTMLASPVLALTLGALVWWARPSAFAAAAPFLVLWLVAPEVARWVSLTPPSSRERISVSERQKLRLLARKTWRFFDVFVTPNDQWLPIDNYQEEPREQTAHRTSPTNIGLSLLATLTAYDFGYVGPSELSLRLRRAFDSIARLEHDQGHLLNWYDTKNLQPLLPRYVSTVDSGNFAGCLLALKQGCRDVAASPVVRAETWAGLVDSVDLLDEALAPLPRGVAASLRAVVASMRRSALEVQNDLRRADPTLRQLCHERTVELDREVLAFLESGEHRHEVERLHAIQTAVGRLHQQLHHMRRELDGLVPWLALSTEAAAHGLELPLDARLDDIAPLARRLRTQLEATQAERRSRGAGTDDLDASAQRLATVLHTAETNAAALVVELLALADLAQSEAHGMDFGLLYNRERRLFHIGYNATVDQLDTHCYDLLASEARLASYVAIVKRDVPVSHWYALGRPMTRVAGSNALLSWGGSMFEYLMPTLLMRSQEGTLLSRTTAAVVDAQIAYGRLNQEPWGISESAFSHVDGEQTYQYRSFGVPGLGFKRGLEEDRVVTPYASVLALSIRPRAVIANLARLEAMGLVGTYGLFEAVDFRPERSFVPGADAKPYSVVRSYMAHHQGMLLVALGNALNPRTMVDRFHADPLIETGEVMLNERANDVAPTEWPLADASKVALAHEPTPAGGAPAPWSSDLPTPQAFVLSNGRLTSVLTGSGGGGLTWQGLALTRFEADATRDDARLWLYVRDEQSRQVWRATAADGRTTYAMHQVEFHRREQGISMHVDVAVAAADDVEVRQVTLHNETNVVRQLTVTSAGRPVLFGVAQAPSHPAFSSLFVESERLDEMNALVFMRRPQTPDEERAVLVHRLVCEGGHASFVGSESDRGAFVGRGGTLDAPRSLGANQPARRGGPAGPVLDPVMSLKARVTLQPKGSVTIAFVTAVARSRSAAVDLAQKYGSTHAVHWAIRDAEHAGPRRLQRAKVDPWLLPTVQRLFSALLFADPSLRAPPKARAVAPPNQHRLWARGLSGDHPLVVVRVNAPEAPILREVLAAQRYLRSCGVTVDVVLLDEQASGYLQDGLGTLRSELAQNDAVEWLNRRGGVFVFAVDQLSGDDVRHLEACARVLFDTRDGSLGARMSATVEAPPKLPRFEPTVVDRTGPKPLPHRPLLFDNGLGGFTPDGREYVIDVHPGQPTPAPWCNVLANPDFGCLVSESSFGTTWSLNSGENRLTPWKNDPVTDEPSEALYLRDEETAAVWSTTPSPAGAGAATRVRHGAGYTTYERNSQGLVQTLTVFVPPHASLKVIRLQLQNTLPRHRRLTATYYAEWVLGGRREQQRPHTVSEFERSHSALLATCSWKAEFAGRVAFVASRARVHGFTTDRTEFLGRSASLAHPEGLERWGLSGRTDLGADPCAALQVHLELAPGETLETHFVLGQAADRDEALRLVAQFRDPAAVETAWQALNTHWGDLLGQVQVKTPEPSMDLLLNRWLLYQTVTSRLFGRTGFSQSSGAFGYRDQLQDVLALLHSAPQLARAHLLEAARHQFEEGDVLHWWHPPAGQGVRTRCSDDLAWLPYATAEYVTATGDTGVLDERVPFLVGEPLRPEEHDRYARYQASSAEASLFEHCKRAVDRAVTAGAHGLPLMGGGDWNDGMSRIGADGHGESVWLGWFLCATMNRFADLSTQHAEPELAATWHARARLLRAKLHDVAWDGAWYLRAFHDDGSLVGSAKSRECRIDSIAQSWAVLSSEPGAPLEPRAREAVRAADEQLVREAERLVLLFWPPFDTTSHDPGYVRAYPPGVRENGGQYTHAATWLGFAHAGLGDGQQAERIFRLLNPVLRTSTRANVARYRVEPYVVAADIYSCTPWVGRGGWTWYTGSAAWLWRLGVEAILGLRRVGGQLVVDPCIPPKWGGFEAWVRVGSRRVHVVVENPTHVASGVAAMTFDGVATEALTFTVDSATEGAHEVRVTLGPRDQPPFRV